MLSFEQKKAVLASFPELTPKEVSLKRVNYHFEDSAYEKTIVVYHLHPNGNGFVFAGNLPGYEVDGKGYVNIRDFSEEALRKVVAASIRLLADEPAVAEEAEEAEEETSETKWVNKAGSVLVLAHEDLLWNVYTGMNLEESFESEKEAERYLTEEGFRPMV